MIMRAAYYEKTGPAQEVLCVGSMSIPVAQAGEVLVRVHASGVNPSDVKKREGRMPAPADFPKIIPHSDGAGVIDAVGPGVGRRVGERVWLWNAQWKRAFGTAAEYVALPAAQAVPLPDSLSFAEGACLGIPAQTAWVAVMDGQPANGRTVLVHGGAGSVGEMAVAIAAASGARVIATVSTDEKAAIAKAAGAEVVRYRETDAVQVIMALTGGIDHIVDVDFGANWRVNAAVLKANGSIAAYSAPSAPVFEMDYYAFAAIAARLRFIQVYLLPRHERKRASAGLDTLLREGRLPVRIARRFSLDAVVAAHEYQESGAAIGNIVIDVSGECDA